MRNCRVVTKSFAIKWAKALVIPNFLTLRRRILLDAANLRFRVLLRRSPGAGMDTDAVWRALRSPAVVETVKTIVYSVLIVSVILTFIFRPYVIPSSSMKDTLLVGDYVFVT